jgi:hypothetical protein
MKTFLSYFALAVLIITSSFTIDTQQKLNEQSTKASGCFNYFRTHRQGKGITATWSVNTQNVVQFVVQRSYDGDFYEYAGSVNFSNSNSFKFTDENVFPGVIYYRIVAIKSDATTETSDVESVRIVQHG